MDKCSPLNVTPLLELSPSGGEQQDSSASIAKVDSGSDEGCCG
jgi:hypothetical protein